MTYKQLILKGDLEALETIVERMVADEFNGRASVGFENFPEAWGNPMEYYINEYKVLTNALSFNLLHDFNTHSLWLNEMGNKWVLALRNKNGIVLSYRIVFKQGGKNNNGL